MPLYRNFAILGANTFTGDQTLTAPANTDATVTINTTTSGQASVLKFSRGGAAKVRLIEGGDNVFRLIDDVNSSVNFYTYSHANATTTLGYNAAITLTSALVATFAGTLVTVASATGAAGLRLPHGAAPTSPVNGDVWTTTAGLFVRINGATVGPLIA